MICPWAPRATIFEHDRAALIGDGRNDENLISPNCT